MLTKRTVNSYTVGLNEMKKTLIICSFFLCSICSIGQIPTLNRLHSLALIPDSLTKELTTTGWELAETDSLWETDSSWESGHYEFTYDFTFIATQGDSNSVELNYNVYPLNYYHIDWLFTSETLKQVLMRELTAEFQLRDSMVDYQGNLYQTYQMNQMNQMKVRLSTLIGVPKTFYYLEISGESH